MAIWCDEVHADAVRFGLKVRRTLFAEHSPIQRIDIVETEALGRALMLDGLWMTAEGDEAAYHELLCHPALTTAPRIERVLIIGGGDGGTAREVLRHPEVESVQLVEVDARVIAACQAHLSTIGSAWDDPRLHVVVGDGVAFVAEAREVSYDVILIDGSDPVGPAAALYQEAFFQACARALRPRGVLATQGESPTLMRDTHLDLIRTLRRVFPVVRPYYGTVTIYPGGAWSWIYASKGVDPMAPLAERVARAEATAQVYNRDVHVGAFAVPTHIRRALADG
jgi:spermidine synthase